MDAAWSEYVRTENISSKAGLASSGVNVCFGSKADIAALPINVRFTPKSGHWNSVAKCPLCANSGHRAIHSKQAELIWQARVAVSLG
jgi:hypothetical protein